MGRRDAEGRTDIDKFRKNIVQNVKKSQACREKCLSCLKFTICYPNQLQVGKQEFKGRSKKKTLSIRDKAQSKRSSGRTIQIVVLYLLAILALLVSLYFLFYTVYASNKEGKHSS